ncbi:CRT (chloroquine-resistance transporter)-like transporter 2 [Zostera marina]|uniref:CRT (Chloroquine-resistance transporter)-like transporter 2 n=1 Tax=Zostera marina TaxID=29655 RepID=A0A0K9NIW7_ZOSMR|nr:CRT (chloroquine-resistance transporter)-like transporter 2 [Zostera marina]
MWTCNCGFSTTADSLTSSVIRYERCFRKPWIPASRIYYSSPFVAHIAVEFNLVRPLEQRRRRSSSAVRWSALGRRNGIDDLGDGAHHLEENKVLGEEEQGDEEDHDRREVEKKKKNRMAVLTAAAATVVLGTGNRILYKLALVPLRQHPFFLAQLATFGYVVVYFSILYWRYHAGIVTDEMLSLPKTPYVVVGLLEALGAASGMAAGAVLSGASIPILSQSFLIWQLILSAIFLGRKYCPNEILGCFLVSIGVILTVISGSGSGVSFRQAGIFWTLLMITSFFFQAADTVLKEVIFLDAIKKCKGRSLDLFVVNSFGSAFQALFLCLLIPFLSKLWGVPFYQLPTYIRDGAGCFLNIGTVANGCEGAPLLPVMFVIVNMGFNISLLHLLKISSAVVSCLAATFTVPISIYAFTLPLPYMSTPSTLSTGFLVGVVVLLSGLLLYCMSSSPLPREK